MSSASKPNQTGERILQIIGLIVFFYLTAVKRYLPGSAIHIDIKWAQYGMLSQWQIFFIAFFSWGRLLLWGIFCAVYFWRQPPGALPSIRMDFQALWLVGLGMILHVVGQAGEIVEIGMLSLFVCLYAFFWWLAGRSWARLTLVPYIFLMLCFHNTWVEWIGISTWLKIKALYFAGSLLHFLHKDVLVESLSVSIRGQMYPVISLVPSWQQQSSTSWIPLLFAPFLGILFLFWKRVKTSWMLVYVCFVPVTGFMTQIIKILFLTWFALFLGEGFTNATRSWQMPFGVLISLIVEAFVLWGFWTVWRWAGCPRAGVRHDS